MVRSRRRLKKIEKESPEDIAEGFSQFVNEIDVPIIIDPLKLIPTGITPLNLECSGRMEGAFCPGTIVNIIGDSHAGKTLLGFTIFAEMSIYERFDHYRFIFDDVEAANAFNMQVLFGNAMVDRMEDLAAIAQTDEKVTHDGLHKSVTIEDFSDNLAKAIATGVPFIYILDSFDALTTEAAQEKDVKNRKLRDAGKESTGSYGDGKAKKASEMFSLRTQGIKQTESLVIIISQVRENIGFGSMFSPKTRSGGKALRFYSAHEIWLACAKSTKSNNRISVTDIHAKIEKNKLTGGKGSAFFSSLYGYGLDNTTACVLFLLNEKKWKKNGEKLNSLGFIPKKIDSKRREVDRTLKESVMYIEEHDLHEDLFSLCQTAYEEAIRKLKPKRKKRY